MLYYWRISRLERHNGHKVKWEKSHFDSNAGISCREETRARIKPSRDFRPKTTFVTSVTSLTCHCTACVWQGNSGKMTAGVTSWVQPVAYLGFHKEGKFSLATIVLTQFLKRGKASFPNFFQCKKKFGQRGGHGPIPPPPKYATEFSVCHGLGHRRFRDRVECPIDHVEVFHCVKVWFLRNLEPLHLSTEVCSSNLYHSTQSQLSYVWSLVRNHGQEQFLRVSEVLVSLNDGINYLLVLGAEVSWLD